MIQRAIPAYLGAMSDWFTFDVAWEIPSNAPAIHSKTTAKLYSQPTYPTPTKHAAGPIKPEGKAKAAT